ncbi:prefoldin subunit [Candidatus Pacearchaeota archaeon]|nr:prefoldin subunit [Candidatus Pacearchaeota archaeon]
MEKDNQQIQELQMLEQSIQNLFLQKQVFQLELNETQKALEEIKDSRGDIFKIIGQLMIKTDGEKVEKELEGREKMLDLKLKSLEKQEKTIVERADDVRKEVIKNIK